MSQYLPLTLHEKGVLEHERILVKNKSGRVNKQDYHFVLFRRQ